MSLTIKKGDTVIVRVGSSRGTKGKVTRVLDGGERFVVEGANIRKRRERPRKQGQKGQVVEVAMPLRRAAVNLFCEKCGKGVRVGALVKGKTKTRICRSCKREI